MDNKRTLLKSIAYLIVIILLIALDQITKDAAVANLMGSDPYVIIDNILELVYVENRGAAFGIMYGMRSFFLILAPAVACILFVMLIKMPSTKRMAPLAVCFVGIAAGAMGNYIDRFKLAYVVDFIYFKPIDFPVFNVADIYVTCCSILLMILLLFVYKDEEFAFMSFRKKAADTDANSAISQDTNDKEDQDQ